MRRATKIVRNLYRDSVSLMQLSDTLGKVPGVSAESARRIFEFFHARPG